MADLENYKKNDLVELTSPASSEINGLASEYQQYMDALRPDQVSGSVRDNASGASKDPRAGEAQREGEHNQYGGYARDEQGRINEYQYNNGAHSYKVGYDSNGEINRVVTPEGIEFNKRAKGWSINYPEGYRGLVTRTPYVQLGHVTIDENGLHTNYPDGARSLKLPDGGHEPVNGTSNSDAVTVREARTLHTQFKAVYKGDQVDNGEVRQGEHVVAQFNRNNDGTYTLDRDGEKTQVRNVRFDEETRTVSYEDNQGKRVIVQQGDTTYRNGRPSVTAKGLIIPSLFR